MLPDIQNEPDQRQILIQQVGICDLTYPIDVLTENGMTRTTGTFDLSIELAAHKKGCHLSRFVDVLHERQWIFSLEAFPEFLHCLIQKLDAHTAYGSLTFPVFLEKTAPISGIKSYLNYEVAFHAQIQQGQYRLFTLLRVPVTSLCPCSKAISQSGAHNQRCLLTLTLETTHLTVTPFETWIRLLEHQGSCELYALLKRADEKQVTEAAFNNPKFVEDIVRDVAQALNHHPAVSVYRIIAKSFESIHHHNAYAMIEKGSLPIA